MLVSTYNSWYTVSLFYLKYSPEMEYPFLANDVFSSDKVRFTVGMQPLRIRHIHPPSNHWINATLITEFPSRPQHVRKGNPPETLEKMGSWAVINPRLFFLLRFPITALQCLPLLSVDVRFPNSLHHGGNDYACLCANGKDLVGRSRLIQTQG